MQYIWTFLNENTGAVQAISTVVLVAITFWYAWRTHRLVKVTEQSEKERNRPRIQVYMKQREDWLNFLELVVENFGESSAYNIQFELPYENLVVQDLNQRKLSDFNFIQKGIKHFAAKQRLKIFLMSLIGTSFDELGKKNVVVRVTYHNAVGESYTDDFHLDFNALIENQVGKPVVYDIKDKLDSMAKSLKSIDHVYKRKNRHH